MDLPTCFDSILLILLHLIPVRSPLSSSFLPSTPQEVQQSRQLAIKSSVMFTRERLHSGILSPPGSSRSFAATVTVTPGASDNCWPPCSLARSALSGLIFTDVASLLPPSCQAPNVTGVDLLLNCSFISQTSIPAGRKVWQRPLKAQVWQENEIRLPRGLPVKWTWAV